jgi:hypothetical protein
VDLRDAYVIPWKLRQSVLKEVASVLARLIRICFELAELCAMNRI